MFSTILSRKTTDEIFFCKQRRSFCRKKQDVFFRSRKTLKNTYLKTLVWLIYLLDFISAIGY